MRRFVGGIRVLPYIKGQYGHVKLRRAVSALANDFELADGKAFDLLMTECNLRCQPS